MLSIGICWLLVFCSFMGVKAGKTHAQWPWELTGSHGEDDSALSTYPFLRQKGDALFSALRNHTLFYLHLLHCYG